MRLWYDVLVYCTVIKITVSQNYEWCVMCVCAYFWEQMIAFLFCDNMQHIYWKKNLSSASYEKLNKKKHTHSVTTMTKGPAWTPSLTIRSISVVLTVVPPDTTAVVLADARSTCTTATVLTAAVITNIMTCEIHILIQKTMETVFYVSSGAQEKKYSPK